MQGLRVIAQRCVESSLCNFNISRNDVPATYCREQGNASLTPRGFGNTNCLSLQVTCNTKTVPLTAGPASSSAGLIGTTSTRGVARCAITVVAARGRTRSTDGVGASVRGRCLTRTRTGQSGKILESTFLQIANRHFLQAKPLFHDLSSALCRFKQRQRNGLLWTFVPSGPVSADI